MKRLLALAIAALSIAGCTLLRHHGGGSNNVYAQPIFYTRYLNANNPLDQRIQQTLAGLRANPQSASLHNQLGQLLVEKGFPKDAETEFERAINSDRGFYPAWYNLGLARASRNDYTGARIAFGRAIHYKPGHAPALFQMGLMEEQRGNEQAAIADYAKAIAINRSLLDVKVNPRVLDSRLIHLALIRNYQTEHARESMLFEPTPQGYGTAAVAAEPAAPSHVPATDRIQPPAAPVTDPARQTPAPAPVPPRTQT